MPEPERTLSGTTIAGNEVEQALALETTDVPEPALGAVDVEGTAEEEHVGAGDIVAWLFRAAVAPVAVGLDALPELVDEDENFVWIELSGYSASDLEHVADLLQLDPLGVRLALSSWQRPRVDVFGDHFHVGATLPQEKTGERNVVARQLDLFVGRNFLVSAHKQKLPFVRRLQTRTRFNPELVRLDSGYMLYLILDELLEYYQDLAERVESEVEALEERALSDTSEAFLADLLHFKRYVFALQQLTAQHRPVFAAFLRPDFAFVRGAEMRSYYQDLEAHFVGLADTMASVRDSVTGAFDMYVSHVAHQTNRVMKTLTMVTTLLLPASLIIGFFSTSFQNVPINNPSFLVVMVCAILLVTGGILAAFRRQGWF